jgi:hypothetical protein
LEQAKLAATTARTALAPSLSSASFLGSVIADRSGRADSVETFRTSFRGSVAQVHLIYTSFTPDLPLISRDFQDVLPHQ